METFDLIVLLILAVGFLVGAIKGFVKQFVSIICIIVGIVAARALSPVAASMFDEAYYNVAYGASFALVFILVLLVGVVVSKALKALLDSIDLGCFNRLAGGALCSFKYLIVIGVIINLVEILGAKDNVFPEGVEKTSVLYDVSKKSLGSLMPFVETVSKTTSDLIEKGIEATIDK